MADLGRHELGIVAVLLGLLAVVALTVYAVVHALRQRAMREPPEWKGTDPEPVYAGFWNRVTATVLDNIVLLIPTRAAYAAGLVLAGGMDQMAAFALPTLLWLAYFVVGNGRGATLGKRWTGLRVVDATGSAPGMRRALARFALPLAVGILGWVPLAALTRAGSGTGPTPSVWVIALLLAVWAVGAVDALWMIRDPHKQTLHDKLAGTFVVFA